MAKGKKTGGRDFPKGHTYGGRKALPEEIRVMAGELKPEFIRAYCKLSQLSFTEAKQYKPESTIEAGILKCLLNFAQTGRTDQIYKIWDQTHGKPKESIDISSGNDIHKVIVKFVGKDGIEREKPDDLPVENMISPLCNT